MSACVIEATIGRVAAEDAELAVPGRGDATEY